MVEKTYSQRKKGMIPWVLIIIQMWRFRKGGHDEIHPDSKS